MSWHQHRKNELDFRHQWKSTKLRSASLQRPVFISHFLTQFAIRKFQRKFCQFTTSSWGLQLRIRWFCHFRFHLCKFKKIDRFSDFFFCQTLKLIFLPSSPIIIGITFSFSCSYHFWKVNVKVRSARKHVDIHQLSSKTGHYCLTFVQSLQKFWGY